MCQKWGIINQIPAFLIRLCEKKCFVLDLKTEMMNVFGNSGTKHNKHSLSDVREIEYILLRFRVCPSVSRPCTIHVSPFFISRYPNKPLFSLSSLSNHNCFRCQLMQLHLKKYDM